MSQVANCPTCGGKSKIKVTAESTTYQAIQNEDLLKKVGQLKKMMEKYKNRSENLEAALKELKSK